ncbi:MAG: hypothetical protein SFX73_10970 [Kofleriaceae bacterium]|nr:hypothetical protein [Kofleriaceae bacterium]
MRRRHRGGRVVLLAFAILGLLLTSAFAERPKVAVLGLEVVGVIDQRVTTVAQELTQGLRARPRSGNGPYLLAANSDRELIDEKMIKSCDDEALKCMTAIGVGVGTDILIYGNVKKDGDNLVVTVHSLDVKKKAKLKDVLVTLAANAPSEAIRAAAKKAYTDLTGDVSAPSGGKLVIKTNVTSGTVFVDDVQKDTLTNGTTMIALAEGRYRVAVEAEGRLRKEIEVKVTDDETITEQFDLEMKVVQPMVSGGGKSGVWKPAFYATAIGTVALAALSVYAYADSQSLADGITGTRPGCTGDNCALTQDDCGTTVPNDSGNFEQACGRYSLHKWTLVGSVVLGIAAAGTGYMAFVRGGGSKESATKVAVTPTVGPDGSGAMVRVTW